ncbi:hypothetical protein LTR91_025007 [Friedmanniomyces endolithicus]|uniref:BTB domain-containing protein n=1 Tax=Friedmanniomyces endolithicus TaxID=329885 RepID=A0AAN6JWD5_9PEZI|nr:hypothetical protein LTR94_021417 [Friedmanniomyces endolithicus]KAK0771421.1 hypothetical protein LTR59_016108 [Friedmanniomyces endolithicus]KAK0771856.1 hypothetical protein LTR75_017566 [Friedmanniomyces endolithicus]KAK0772165.1 hypothetical protein LTR38_016972 [Friedmanniomyces endolithicus]KAK0891834.1 hypothetical protein LTR57_024645 [Friedmanniomyces endolithicus]
MLWAQGMLFAIAHFRLTIYRHMRLSISPAADMPRDAFDCIVHIDVGEKRRRFEAHRGVISFYSGYFDRAFNGDFAEAASGELTMKSEDPDTL